MDGSGYQPYSKAERLLNLLMALRSTRTGLDRDQIRAQVRGYRPEASGEAFERMFERDKDELRSMGIPITTVLDATGNVTGYRIEGSWELPPLALDPAELAILSVAARAWQSTDLAPAALHALRKVETSLGVQAPPASQPVAGMSSDSPGLRTLLQACSTRTAVRFGYRKDAARPREVRHVQPWGLVWWRAHWYLVGHDLDRSGQRVFRASRIEGEVHQQGPSGSYEVPDGFDPRDAVGRFTRDDEVRLQVALAPGRGAALRRGGQDLGPRNGWDVVELVVPDVASGVARVLGSGSGGRVTGPAVAVAEAGRQLDAILSAAASAPARAGRASTPDRPGAALAQFSRLLALVPWLAANSGVSLEAAAAHFGISVAQLVADLSSVITSGPDDWTLFDIQYWENGGVIDVIDALHLARPLALTPDEALSLLIALQALAALPGPQDRAALGRVVAKLRDLMGSGAPDPEALAVRVDLPDEVVQPVDQALAQGRALELVYLGAVRDEVTRRTVDPVGIVVVDGYGYLRAHCRSAAAMRLFRVDRVLAATVSSLPAETIPDGAAEAVEPMAVSLAGTGRQVVIDVSPDGRWILDRHPVTRTWPLAQGWVRAELPVGEYAWARDLVLGSGGVAVLREPDWLAEDVVRLARELHPAYGDVW